MIRTDECYSDTIRQISRFKMRRSGAYVFQAPDLAEDKAAFLLALVRSTSGMSFSATIFAEYKIHIRRRQLSENIAKCSTVRDAENFIRPFFVETSRQGFGDIDVFFRSTDSSCIIARLDVLITALSQLQWFISEDTISPWSLASFFYIASLRPDRRHGEAQTLPGLHSGCSHSFGALDPDVPTLELGH